MAIDGAAGADDGCQALLWEVPQGAEAAGPGRPSWSSRTQAMASTNGPMFGSMAALCARAGAGPPHWSLVASRTRMMAMRRCCAMDHSSRARREWCTAGAGAPWWSDPPLACRSTPPPAGGPGEPLRARGQPFLGGEQQQHRASCRSVHSCCAGARRGCAHFPQRAAWAAEASGGMQAAHGCRLGPRHLLQALDGCRAVRIALPAGSSAGRHGGRCSMARPPTSNCEMRALCLKRHNFSRCAAGSSAPGRGVLRRARALLQHGEHAAVHRTHEVLRVQDRVERLHLQHVPPDHLLAHTFTSLPPPGTSVWYT